MRNKRRKLGFTMAELLIVVAIIGVLAGVAFIAVNRHQRSMAQLERNNIAKEIFVAAQNHLTMAESQGYLADARGSDYFGTSKTESKTESGKTTQYTFQYIVASGGSHADTILDLMLPFGAIDQTVLSGGSYLIRYQTNPAQVLDVFYCSTSDTTAQFNHTITKDEYATLMGYKPDSFPTTGYIVGWYGDVALQRSGAYLDAPAIVVNNAEKLTVTITDTNLLDDKKKTLDPSLKLIIEGVQSGAKASFLLNSRSGTSTRLLGTKDDTDTKERVYTLVLDDITTANMHFADLNTTTDVTLNKEGVFIPGEDITVYAVAYSNATLTNIAYSAERTTNSLFADVVETTEPGEGDNPATVTKTAMIANFRHLENLSSAISGVNVTLDRAEQAVDLAAPEDATDTLAKNLSWTGFVDIIKEVNNSTSVSVYDRTDGATQEGCYYPVVLPANIEYDGKHHKITDVKVDTTTGVDIENGGLFASANGATIRDLEMIDFSVTAKTGNAGALAGTLTGTTVTNVVARNSASGSDATITTASGSAGGLVGIATNATISKSAAALVVSNTGTDTDDVAGGLVGASAGGSITGCYSGGHTIDKKNGDTVIGVEYDSADYNVTAAAGSAGGLVGAAGSTEISYSYSTCSVKGATAGGFVGKATGAISNCYATGLVSLVDETSNVPGAFADSVGTSVTNCRFFEIINERDDASTGGKTYLTALPNNVTNANILPLDQDTINDPGNAKYNDYTNPANWSDAIPYDRTLATYYGTGSGNARITQYNLPSVAVLDALDKTPHDSIDVSTTAVTDPSTGVTTPADFVATHYGDWPAPEIFVINTK